MNRIAKAIFAVLILFAMTTRLEAQTPYRQYADNGVVLNFFEIDNYDFRLFLLNNLSQDNRFTLIAEDENGKIVVIPASEDDDNGFFDTFESVYNDAVADFSMLSKHEIFDLIPIWKSNVSPIAFTSITMDLTFHRTITLNNHCVDSDPFCTSDVITFNAASSSQTADQLEGVQFDDGCIGSSYNPSWYHMRINTPGQFIIHMEGHDPNNGTNRDIDFCMWGPYDDPTAPCVAQLTTDKIIDCNYSSSYSEDIYLGYTEGQHQHQANHGTINEHMPETGEYFILMITNYSQQPCVISFTKAENSGPGTTDCGILPGNASNDGPYCEGETIHLTITGQPGATFSWTGPNGFTSTEQNPIIPNCTPNMAGDYNCVITVGGETTSASTTVEIYQQANPSFTATTVCQGEPTVFNGQASGSNVAVYEWDFGDGNTETGQNVDHTYAQAGTFQVTLFVSAEDGSCPAETTQTVTVNAQPVADAGPDQTVDYGLQTQLNGTGGGSGFNYHWDEPVAGLLNNLNIQNPQTTFNWTQELEPLYVFTLTVTNPQGGCVSTDEVIVYTQGSALTASIAAESYEFCEGGSTQISVTALFGTGNYTYSWAHNPSLNIATINVSPTQTTTYTCTVNDGQTSQTVSTTITVYHPETLAPAPIVGECDLVPVTWTDGQGNVHDTVFYKNTTYTFVGFTEHGCHQEQTYHIETMQYTPRPEIVSADPNVEFPHAPVTATEFNVNQYTYTINDTVSDISGWLNDQCEWKIDKDSWRIVTSNDHLSCTVYAMDWTEDTIWLTFKAVNPCGSDSVKYWLKPSFYGVDENEAFPALVNILPNPNNGEMELRFENMEGRIQVRVFNTNGTLIDNFEIQNQKATNTYNYSMKRLANGVYFFAFTDGKKSITKKVVVIQ